MQFPVPQFTDVEDKIIAGLTFKQFAIIFGAAVFTFVIFTISKNEVITAVVGVCVGLPALALTFGKLNGRPLYSSFTSFLQFVFGPKLYVYHKQVKAEQPEYFPVRTDSEQAAPKNAQLSSAKMTALNTLLQKEQKEQVRLLELIKQNHNKQ